MSNKLGSPAITRLEQLLDTQSFVQLQELVSARSTEFNLQEEKQPSDGVVIGHGLIDGNLVFVFSQDASVLGGTIGEMHAKKITNIYNMAMKVGAPVIGLIDCGGVRLQESFDALEALGGIINSAVNAQGYIPTVLGVFGQCGGGLSVLSSLSDFVYMTEDAKLFVNSADAIVGNSKDKLDTTSAQFAFENSGNVDFVGSEAEIFAEIRKLVGILPPSAIEKYFDKECTDDINRGANLSAEALADAALFATEISDNNFFVETKAGYAKNMVTGFAMLDGITVGVVGNREIDGEAILTAEGCVKATEFIDFCDSFNIPLLSVTNVEGFDASVCAEKRLPRALARMTKAFAEAQVAKINVVTKNAFGSAYVLMNSKAIGADLVYALDGSKVGVMDAKLAASIVNPENTSEFVSQFDAMQNSAYVAASRGYVDRIVAPVDVRKYLISGIEMLYGK